MDYITKYRMLWVAVIVYVLKKEKRMRAETTEEIASARLLPLGHLFCLVILINKYLHVTLSSRCAGIEINKTHQCVT